MNFGRRLAGELGPGAIVSLEGGLGAGKTTLAKGIAAGLGVHDTVTSPTFTIISEYLGRIPLYHMDLYRIEDEEELYNLGIDDFLYGDGVCLIEWIDRLPQRPSGTIRIAIESEEGGAVRSITVDDPAEEVQ